MASGVLLRYPDVLRGLGVSPTADSVRFTFEHTTDGTRSLWVRVPDRTDPVEWRRVAARLPLYLSRSDEPFWFTPLPEAEGDSSTIYLALNGYPDYLSFWRR